jgi:CubicO group peptidase (beta-lactamase class C family)
MKKAMRAIIVVLCAITGAFVLLLIISSILYSPEYIYRVLSNGESKITDYQIFPTRVIAKSTDPYTFDYAIDDSFGSAAVRYRSGDAQTTQSIDDLLKENGTTSCIVITGDKVIYEEYFNGHNKDSIETSFSSVKSLVSLMIGMAIEDGYIVSIDQTIAEFIPEYEGTPFEDITIENLLMMRSDISYSEGFAWFTDDAKTYYMPDLRDIALHHMRIDPDYSGQFHYNNYHPLILGIILERATGMHVADYFQKKIWDTIGAEYDASWSLDSEASGFEKMESGLNFSSIDYAKIGCMLLHGGKWNGSTVIGEDWIALSTIAPKPLAQSDIDSAFLKGKEVGYQYMWYSIENDRDGHDFFSAGKYGQYLYISPENNTVIVRTGMSMGRVDWWPDVFRQMAEIARGNT